MAYGFDFSGLFQLFGGELTVYRIVTGIVRYQVSTHGPQGYAIRSINRIRSRFGISQTEAAALFKDIRDNIQAARRINELRRSELVDPERFPHSPNVLGENESHEKYVYSGYAEIVDDYGEVVRRVPWVVEGSENLTVDDLLTDIGESMQGFIDKYSEELLELLQGGELNVSNIQINFVAKR